MSDTATALLEVPEGSDVEYPHMRPLPTTTIGQLAETYDPGIIEALSVDSGEGITVSPDKMSVQVASREVELSEDGIDQLLSWADFPKAFFKRLDHNPTRQVEWLNALLHDKSDRGIVRVGAQSGLISVLAPNQVPITPIDVIRVARSVLGDGAPVIESLRSPTEFDLDVLVDPRRGTPLGDPQIGDITMAGLRFGMNLRQNLAPTVNPYYYRLWCTNGCDTQHEETKLDARGQSVEEVLAELEIKAELAFGMVEHEVAAMYSLRNEVVENPERTISRMAREQDLSDRMRMRMIDSWQSMVPDPENVTMFDIVQVATHVANSPAVSTRGGREALENFGGSVVATHVERCVSCASRLN